jgi:oligoendopeptidase F
LYYFQVFFKNLNHILSPNIELVLNKVSQSRFQIYDLYDVLAFADKKKKFIFYRNKKQLLTLPLYQEILEKTDPKKDQLLRKKTTLAFSDVFITHKHSFAKFYNSIVKLSLEETKLRKYENFLTYFTKNDCITEQIYHNLLNAGKKMAPIYRRYINLKKSFFSMDKFFSSDNQLSLAVLSEKEDY